MTRELATDTIVAVPHALTPFVHGQGSVVPDHFSAIRVRRPRIRIAAVRGLSFDAGDPAELAANLPDHQRDHPDGFVQLAAGLAAERR